MPKTPIRALVVAAMPQEAQPFLDALTACGSTQIELGAGSQSWRLAAPRPHQAIVLIRSGIGAVASASALATALTAFAPDFIISAGTAGGIGQQVRIGDVCISTTLAYADADATAFGYAHGQMPGQPPVFTADPTLQARAAQALPALQGASPSARAAHLHQGQMLSGNSFVTAANIKDVRQHFPQAVSTDMESAALAQVAHGSGIPFLSARGISDLCGPQAGQDFHIGVDEAAARSAAVILELLR